MKPYFDACVLSAAEALGESPELPEGFGGLLLHGPTSKALREELSRWHPDKTWKHAETLDRIVGETHAAFPTRKAAVVDLVLEDSDLRAWLKSPAEWWPLCESLRAAPRLLRVHLPAGTSSVSLFKQVARRFPRTQFWLDPFVHGPVDGWQGQVRIAEMGNIWLSTLGLFPMEQGLWSGTGAQDALHFLIGEVGAEKLFYASGMAWEDTTSGRDQPYREWLTSSQDLKPLELRMVLETTLVNLLQDQFEDDSVF